jgi:rhodanese-related sulfurtransferase
MIEDISPVQVKTRLENSEKFCFIDVREEWEYEELNIGAELIPLGDLPARISELEDMKGEEIIVHCKSGARSGRAKKYLISKGFTNVRSMEGGIEAFLGL